MENEENCDTLDLSEPVLEVVLLVMSDKRSIIQKLTIDYTKLTDQTLNYMGNVSVDSVEEVNLIKSIEAKESGLKLEAKNARGQQGRTSES